MDEYKKIPNHPVIEEMERYGEYIPRHLRDVLDFGMDDETCARCGSTGEIICGLCEECRVKAIVKFKYYLRNEFDEHEREWLNNYYDGEELV